MTDFNEQLVRDALERWTKDIEDAGPCSEQARIRREWAYGAYVALAYRSELADGFLKLAMPALQERTS